MSPLFLGNFGTGEIMLLGLIILVFFGGKKIPELMRGLGSGIREFNNAKNNIHSEVKENIRELEEKERSAK
ncbi:MAG: twin-arginine translocase TatA/TatE family subunit [Saprospiraceae bacterium]|jgi:sec-independent protein translocase protein TatA|nr:twin-arginine translocase TatA/TatE family subunit [Saprospiraceae bacterium]